MRCGSDVHANLEGGESNVDTSAQLDILVSGAGSISCDPGTFDTPGLPPLASAIALCCARSRSRALASRRIRRGLVLLIIIRSNKLIFFMHAFNCSVVPDDVREKERRPPLCIALDEVSSDASATLCCSSNACVDESSLKSS